MTLALRALDAAGVAYTPHTYPYVERGGTRASSEALGVDEHLVIKTIVLVSDAKHPVIALMHGDREVSARSLARVLGAKACEPCKPDQAQRFTGYQVGGTSPFGLRRSMPVVVEASVLELPLVYVNGGRRGLLVALEPQVFVAVLGAKPASIAQ